MTHNKIQKTLDTTLTSDLTCYGTPSPATTTIATPAEQHQQQQQRWRSSNIDNSNNNHKQRRCRCRRRCCRRCRRCHGPSHTGSGQEAGGGHNRHVPTGIFSFPSLGFFFVFRFLNFKFRCFEKICFLFFFLTRLNCVDLVLFIT